MVNNMNWYDTHSKEYNEGKLAYDRNYSINMNPYKDGDSCKAWIAGWEDAQYELMLYCDSANYFHRE